jgi:hypothetical protein
VGGTWEHANEAADREKHPITFRTRIRAELSRMAQAITLVCDGQAEDSAYIDEVQDVASGTVNETLTPGGVVVITGSKIKIAGTKTGVGLRVSGAYASGQAFSTVVPPPYVENTASKIIALLPASLPNGTCKIQINTQYSGGNSLLKDIRVIWSGDLIVGSAAQSGETPAVEGASTPGE